jgi:hypothetical protein
MFSETFRLEPLPDGGTHVTNFSRIHMPLPSPVRRIVARMILLNKFKYDQLVRRAAQLAGEEYKRSGAASAMDKRSTLQSGSLDQALKPE